MIEIYCYRGAGDKEMNAVEDTMITDVQMAKVRGKYEIDRQWFLVHKQSIRVPMRSNDDNDPLNDDDVVTITESHLGISGVRRITGITISGTPRDVSMSLSLEKYQEFT